MVPISVFDHEIFFFLDAPDFSLGKFSQFNTSFTIVLYKVASDIRAAFFASDFNGVVSTLFQQIQPDDRSTDVFAEGTYLNAVLVLVLDCIVDHLRIVTAHLDSNFILVESVANDLKLRIR